METTVTLAPGVRDEIAESILGPLSTELAAMRAEIDNIGQADHEYASMAQDIINAGPGTQWEVRADGRSLTLIDQVAEAARAASDEAVAEMGMGFTSIIEKPLNSLIPGVSAGSIAIGGGLALVVGELIDGIVEAPATDPDAFSPAATRGLVKGVAAFGVAKLGTKFTSPTAARAAATVLTVQALTDLIPLDRAVDWFVGKVRKGTGQGTATAGYYGPAAAYQGQGYDIHAAANEIARGGQTVQIGSPGHDGVDSIFG